MLPQGAGPVLLRQAPKLTFGPCCKFGAYRKAFALYHTIEFFSLQYLSTYISYSSPRPPSEAPCEGINLDVRGILLHA